MQHVQLLRLPDTLKLRAICRSGHYAEIASGLYPKRVKIGKRAAADIEHEAVAINRARAAGKTDDQIRALVRELELARKSAA